MYGDIEDAIVKIRGDRDYISFLLVERPYIRSAIEAHGQVYDQAAKVESYSHQIGNALHNDIIELELWLETLSPQDRKLLLDWAERADSRPYFGRAYIRRVNALIKRYAEKTK